MASAHNSNQARIAIPNPADEFREPRRRGLIAHLLCATKFKELDPITWACLWFADLSALEELVSHCERSSFNNYILRHVLRKNENRTRVFDAWAVARSTDDSETESENDPANGSDNESENAPEVEESDTEEEPPTKKRRLTSGPEESPSISEKEATSLANKLCTERDNASCVITGCRDPIEFVHILPTSMGKMDRQKSISFWDSLEFFWPREKANAWKEQVQGPNGTE
ncbi:hypothetical protein AbraIFM66950_010041, partial [Aspergillus brasiliensis]